MAVSDAARQAAGRIYDAARAGEFRIAEDTGRQLADSCDRLVTRLAEARLAAAGIVAVQGFPDLPSGQGLTGGFRAKGQECLDTLAAFQEMALRYKAAYLAAAALFAEADAANAAAVACAGAASDGCAEK